MYKGVKKVNDFLKDQKLLAVPMDKGCGFRVMKQTTYLDKLNEILSASQFEAHNEKSDDLTIKTEKLTKSSLHQILKQGKISEEIFHRFRTAGLQPARLHRPAKVHKSVTPLQPLLSIPGSSYEILNIFLSSLFERLPDEKIEKDARVALEASELDEDEPVLSLDAQCLNSNVRIEDAIENALKELYSSDKFH